MIVKFIIIALSLILLAFSFSPASAHVGYVIGEENFELKSGLDFGFLFSVFTNPFYIILMIVTLAITTVTYVFFSKNPSVLRWTSSLTGRAEEYKEHVPLLLRLALGSALIGAGSMHETISPILNASSFVASIQVIVGFMLLFGLFIPALAIVTIALYGYAVSQNIYLLGNIDLVAMAIALLLLPAHKPSIDDLFHIPIHKISKKTQELIPLILRVGIGFAMGFLGVYEKILNPHASALVAQQYGLDRAIPVNDAMWVFSTGVIEFLVGLALILGFKTRLVSVIALIVLTASFFFFKEGVSAHVTLFAILVILFITGPGDKSLDKYFGKNL